MNKQDVSELLSSAPVLVETTDGLLTLCLAGRILDHLGAITVIDKIRAWYQKHTPEEIEEHNDTSGMARTGYVYLILSATTRHFKIGQTIDLNRRLHQLKDQYGPIALLHVIECAGTHIETEALLHKRYKRYQVHHEWFSLPPAAIDAIRTIKTM